MSNSTSAPGAARSAKTIKLDHLALENLSLKIADTEEEIAQAQRLRYQVFYEEMGAKAEGLMGADGREIEAYDPYCDHLLVIDNNAAPENQIVGTYRILMQDQADAAGIGFYTEKEFDLSKLKATGGRIMEVSRSCVLKPYRSKMAINLLWKGIAAYVFGHQIDYLIGVPSFNGTDLKEHRDTLAYLKAFHMADESIRPRVLEQFYHPLPDIDKDQINAKKAFMELPPLVKGYLRVGAVISDGVFVDEQFNCIDIAIIVAVANVTDRYFNHFKRSDVE